jgi:hypothetical protein
MWECESQHSQMDLHFENWKPIMSWIFGTRFGKVYGTKPCPYWVSLDHWKGLDKKEIHIIGLDSPFEILKHK